MGGSSSGCCHIHRKEKPVKTLQKASGIAAIVLASSYIFGIGMYVTVLSGSSGDTPKDVVAFLVDNETALLATNSLIYLVAGAALVPLSLGIHERFRSHHPAAMKVGTVFGLMWATVVVASGMVFNVGVSTVADLFATEPDSAATAWVAISAVQDGLGGGSEMIGAIWVLVVTTVAMRFKLLPDALNYLGLLIAAAGLLTIVPALSVFQDVFGLSQIPWFIWIGVVQLRDDRVI
jgi:hypothetical protein